MVTADENYFDLFLVQSLELFSHVGSGRVAGKYAVVEVASYQEEVWPVLKREIDQDVEAVLKVSLPLEPSGTILDGGGVEMVVGCEKNVNRHDRLSSKESRTILLPVSPLASILKLEAAESEAFQAVTPPYHPRFRHSNIPFA